MKRMWSVPSRTSYQVRLYLIASAIIGYAIGENCYTPSLVPGFCVDLQRCDHLLQAINRYNQNGDSSLVSLIQNSICGYDGYNMMVCCPSARFQTTTVNPLLFFTFATMSPNSVNGPTFAPLQPTAPGHVFSTSPPFPTSAPGPNTYGGVLPTFESSRCGMSNATHSRVVGGTPSQVNAWPWITLLGYRSAFEGPKFLCGGTLISQKHVLTAAHCVKDALYMVRLGEHDLTTTAESQTYDINVDLKIVHELFDPKIMYADIAILRLAQPAPFSDKVRPICLPLTDELRQRDYTYYQPFLAGWGATSYRGSQATVLQEVQMPVLPTSDCTQSYKTYFPDQVFDDMVICVGFTNGGKDSCQGDSGSGLMLPQQTRDGSYYYYNLIGIVSYGYECARPGFPGVYTRVTSFIPWIVQRVND